MIRPSFHVFVVTAALCGACSSDSENDALPETRCTPGEVMPCACSNGTQSTQACNVDGQSLGACQCSAGTGGVPNLATGGSGAIPTGGTGAVSTGGVSPIPTGGMGGASGSGGVLVTGGTGGIGGTGGEPPAGGTGGVEPPPPPPPPGDLCLQQGNGDYTQRGPYAVATKTVDLGSFATLPSTPTTFTIFYPQTMESNCPHPVIAWGNGTTVTGSQVYAFYNNNAASWGMIVIASDNPNVGSGSFHRAGIDYMLAQNNDSNSEFYQKISLRAGTSGHSQGAIGATVAAAHANVQAEVQVQGGGTPKAGMAFLALTGTGDTIVGTGPPTQSYNAATGPAFLASYTGADHITTPTLGGFVGNNAGTIQYMRLYTAWFRCFLADDATACGLFRGGASCGICNDPNWDTLQSKNIP